MDYELPPPVAPNLADSPVRRIVGRRVPPGVPAEKRPAPETLREVVLLDRINEIRPAEQLDGVGSLPRPYDENYAIFALLDRVGLVPASRSESRRRRSPQSATDIPSSSPTQPGWPTISTPSHGQPHSTAQQASSRPSAGGAIELWERALEPCSCAAASTPRSPNSREADPLLRLVASSDLHVQTVGLLTVGPSVDTGPPTLMSVTQRARRMPGADFEAIMDSSRASRADVSGFDGRSAMAMARHKLGWRWPT